jgi:hypothetical protein
MPTARPFAYNPSLTSISGTTQVGDLAVGIPSTGFTDSPQFWNGPDEELGYVIAVPISGNTQPTPVTTNRFYLSPTYKAVDIALSNNNQTATQVFSYVQSVLGQTPLNNNLMFSVQFNSTNPSVGVGSRYIGAGTTDMNYQGPFNGYPGTDTLSQGFSDDGKEYYNGNIMNSGLPTWTSGDIIDIALRPNDYWFIRVNGGYWNNDPSADPTTGVGQINLNISSGYPVLCPSIYGSMTIQNYPTYGVPSGYLFLGNVLASVKFFRTSGFTDNSFIDLSEYVSGKFSTPQTFTGATEASTWLTTNGFWNSYSSIVTTNLQLYLDAGNPLSYSGTGNIWYDLSGNGNDVTMQNSGNISWDNSGFFTLTSNGYFNNTSTTNLPIGGSPYTLSVWVQFGSSWNSNGMISVSDTWGSGDSVNAFRTTNTNGLVNYWWANDFAVSFSPASSTVWFNFVATWDGTNRSVWANGIQIGTQTTSGLNVTNGVLNIGNTNNSEYLNGNIGQALIYDVALTSTEIMDNFDNTKSNYGY